MKNIPCFQAVMQVLQDWGHCSHFFIGIFQMVQEAVFLTGIIKNSHKTAAEHKIFFKLLAKIMCRVYIIKIVNL